jgi:multicomponent Na+:H+ antiporter subunit D
VVPLIAIVLLNLPFREITKKLAFYIAFIIILAQAWVALVLPLSFWAQPFPFSGPLSLFHLSVDNLSLLMLLAIAIVAFSSLFVAQETITDTTKRFNFINLLLLTMTGMNGIVLVRDLLSLYVFLEVVGVSSFILICLHKDKAALEGAFKYILLSAIATVMMLSSVALILMIAGDTSFATASALMSTTSGSFITILAVGIFTAGLFIKGGLVPFHGWLPDAYSSAPASVSVLLAGIVTKTTGVYTLIRLVTSVFCFSQAIHSTLLIVGTISILVGALAALGQKDFKRMLAYSSISQVGYIILSLGAGNALGLAGAAFHLFNHSVFKAQLFVNSAAVEEEAGTRDMNRMGGLASNMPVTGTTSVVALLSTAGIPPLSGFWSKIIIVIALWQSQHHGYAMIAILASILTLAYFLSMQRRVFFGKLIEELKHIKEAKAGILIPAVVLALITIGVGVLFPLVLNTFILPISSLLG